MLLLALLEECNFMFLVLRYFKILQKGVHRYASTLIVLLLVIGMIAMDVWGVQMWANMTETCSSFYETDYKHLFLVYKVWVCVMCVGVVFPASVFFFALYLSIFNIKSHEYSEVPDKVDSASDIEQGLHKTSEERGPQETHQDQTHAQAKASVAL